MTSEQIVLALSNLLPSFKELHPDSNYPVRLIEQSNIHLVFEDPEGNVFKVNVHKQRPSTVAHLKQVPLPPPPPPKISRKEKIRLEQLALQQFFDSILDQSSTLLPPAPPPASELPSSHKLRKFPNVRKPFK